ncbi:hypothetical protein [Paractinoplanes toevensis]|uniref:Uncharacterized protein n=1 Tax=Paractinoplanes toevensis TaxID=571911 RepID=A0A919T6U4_9ACTN|nr:hypothetical protein [Actinoplanes toevensis]GIM88814.1 hypothetical protein Ato02nite_006070 [Actinoplanes toevensis]
MTAYDSDPRVQMQAQGDLAVMLPPDSPGRCGWVWSKGDGSGYFADDQNGSRTFHATADEAIHSLIGDPR